MAIEGHNALNNIEIIMKVLKFGGTSVGSVESLRNVKSIVESQAEPTIVVVSALGGVTNQLIEMTRMALDHNEAYASTLEQVRQRHLDIIERLIDADKQSQCRAVVEQFIENLRSFYQTLCINSDLDATFVKRVSDAIVCHGEIMSSAIVAALIAGATPHYSPSFIKTTDGAKGTVLAADLTRRLIQEQLGSLDERCMVLQGFIAQDADASYATTLGRGGSDFTAALVAAALHASCLEIWTDVDGFMTADPRTHPDATVIPTMTYAQAQAMCDAGAKVIYPPTLAPVAALDIPVWVKNTFNPTATGTVIRG